jgi:indolepyruvate decarboxylase
MTVQDLSTIAAHGLAPVVIVLNNDGYTIERALQSPRAAYNDIAAWPWTRLAGDLTGDRAVTSRVTGLAGLRSALEAAAAEPDRMAFLEVVLPADDIPPLLKALSEKVGGSR